jgi:hypothetical protein
VSSSFGNLPSGNPCNQKKLPFAQYVLLAVFAVREITITDQTKYT